MMDNDVRLLHSEVNLGPDNLKQRADDKFRSGLSCTEAILEIICEENGYDASVYLPLATGFRAGISARGCTCGALIGAVMAIGLLAGRSSREGDEKPAQELTRKMYDQFIEYFGTTCCRILNMEDYTSKEHEDRCAEITAQTTAMLLALVG